MVPPYRQVLQIDGPVIQVDIRIGQGSLRNEDIIVWMRRATEAVAVYYVRFPVQQARVIVSQNEDKDESIHGTTWGDFQAVQSLTRMRLGSAVTKADLEEDWTTAGCASLFPWDRTGCERTSDVDPKGHDKPAQATMTQQAM